MKKSRHLAVMALGLSLGLVGLGPTALAKRPHHENPKPEAAGQCSTSQSNDSDNSTGGSSQSGLINVNNIAVQGNNLALLSNLLCQGVFLNDIVAGVLGTAHGGDGGSSGDAADCTTDQDTESSNDTGDSAQDGLINANNVAVQGNNVDALGNLLCGGNFLNDAVASVLGTATGGDSDWGGSGGASDCTTDQETDSKNSTGDSYQGGTVANVNNVAVQGNNIDALGNALCDGNFLNGLTAAVLGTAHQGDGDHDGDYDGNHSGPAACATDQDADSDNETGDSVMGGLLNLNNLAVQGNNVAVLSNGLCGSIFLNDVLVSVLGVI